MAKLFILFTLIFSLSSYAQKEDLTSKTMPLNKKQLINQANKIIASKYPEFSFDSELYEITAWKNSEETIVKYRRIIRFIPLDKKNENLNYDFEVNLTYQEIAPFDLFGFSKFYLPTTAEQVKIDFVAKKFGLPRLGFNNIITEDHDMYIIEVNNEVAFGKYFIDKITGNEHMGPLEGTYTQRHAFTEFVDKDPLTEIKE